MKTKAYHKNTTIITLAPKQYNKYRYNGIHIYGDVYRAEMQYKKRKHHIGQFKTPEEASYSYNVAKQLVKLGLFEEAWEQRPYFSKLGDALIFWKGMAAMYIKKAEH